MVFDLFKQKPERKEDEKDAHFKDEEEKLKKELETANLRTALSRKIIERYAYYINESEEKAIPELKAMVNTKDLAIQEIRKLLLEKLIEKKEKLGKTDRENPYVYSGDFLLIAEECFEYAKSLHPLHPNLPVSFWLTPKEMVELKAADIFDRAILLCTLLRSFEGKVKIRVLDLENGLLHPVVVMRFGEKDYLLDSEQQESSFTSHIGNAEELIKDFSFSGNKCLKSNYEFNDEEYLEY